MDVDYPKLASRRDAWIVGQRPERNLLNSSIPYGYFQEQERSSDGRIVPVNTVLLTNRECVWKCLMCDLWKNTLRESGPPGSIATQIDYALERLPPAACIKLYNSGSFFDSRAIQLVEYPSIAARLELFERVIVESHPALIADSTLRFRDCISGKLEIAMGLETTEEDVLEKLNKRMTLAMFESAAGKLRDESIDVRAFVLIQPPFSKSSETRYWTQRSLAFAFDCGASTVTLIPTRSNNGAMEALQAAGLFTPPDIHTIEAALDLGIGLKRGRVFVDLWDLRSSGCECFRHRIDRLHQMNLEQAILVPVMCSRCQRDA